MNKIQPDVEAPPVLGWLAELESRKENNVKRKLAHEFGAGAPCNNCDRCTGLDLHFWRKSCRVCKCRGEQHDCKDDDPSDFMQFEILGFGKRSKAESAVVSIKAAPEPAHLDWIPPNTDSKLAAEYMNEMETDNIPITGTKAAIKRKERLKYQVPMHDLDASLCHNLSENEASQLTQYVGKIKEQNVGQGVVVRVGDTKYQNSVENIAPSKSTRPQMSTANKAVDSAKPILDSIKRDKILNFVLNSKAIQKAIYYPNSVQQNSTLTLSNQPFEYDFEGITQLTGNDKYKLQSIGLNQEALHSSIVNGRIYDKLFAKLDECKINYGQCSLLQPLKTLRSTYNNGADYNFNSNMDSFATALEARDSIEIVPETIESLPLELKSPQASTANATTEILPLLSALQINEPTIRNDSTTIQKPPENISTGPKAVMVCKTCELPIYAGTVAVKAHRAGSEVAWHPKCFTCNKCGDLLADLVYFFHQGNIYCGRDLAEILKIPRCKACDELIFTKEYTAAEGETFHIKHFCCYHCDTPLAGQEYTPDDETNMPLCLVCYDQYYAEKCHNCHKSISPAEQAVSCKDFHWHTGCFNCAGAKCGRSLIGGRFCIKFDLPFCSSACVQESRI